MRVSIPPAFPISRASSSHKQQSRTEAAYCTCTASESKCPFASETTLSIPPAALTARSNEASSVAPVASFVARSPSTCRQGTWRRGEHLHACHEIRHEISAHLGGACLCLGGPRVDRHLWGRGHGAVVSTCMLVEGPELIATCIAAAATICREQSRSNLGAISAPPICCSTAAIL